MISNCWVYALSRFLRYGGEVRFKLTEYGASSRDSAHHLVLFVLAMALALPGALLLNTAAWLLRGRWLPALWSMRGDVWFEFLPYAQRYRRWLPSPLFRGAVVRAE